MRLAVALLALLACQADRRVPAPGLDLDEPASSSRELVPFSCKTEITGKRPNGELRVTFLPRSERDATWELTWSGPCHYHAEAHLVNGRLDDDVLGKVYEYTCTRSPYSTFAVSCGPYLGSEVDARATGERIDRIVRVRIPWTFHIDAPPDCAPPFVTDGHVDELALDYAGCARLD